MIQFETSRFGKLEVAEDKVIQFPAGLLGFPRVKRYVLLDYEDTPIKWLQAIDDPDVAFIVMEPRMLVQDYTISLDATTRQALLLDAEEDLAILAIVRVEKGQVLANLKGPLLFNSRLKIGIQAVLE
ncbi:MAG TPA: flagellar assembly protein FliW [Syntrophorhabdales bacterium]|nr:flagellar assembly protein FliW [Syntrophorhabdales bacterium]